MLESCAMMPSASGPLAARVHKSVRPAPGPSLQSEAPTSPGAGRSCRAII